MDSQELDSVVHVEVGKTWTDAIVASLRSSDGHISDDEIFEILTTGSDGPTAAALCAARNVTLPMYCVWKAKYRGLSREGLAQARRRELWRTRGVAGLLLATAIMGAGGIVFGLVRAAQATMTVAAGPSSTHVAAIRMDGATSSPAKHSESPNAGNGRGARSDVSAATPTRANHAGSADQRRGTVVAPATPTTETQYRVQVEAAASLEQGRVLVEQLAAAGHAAYVSTAVVKNVEVFRVRVGPFDTLSEAEAVSLQLQRDGYPGAWIAR